MPGKQNPAVVNFAPAKGSVELRDIELPTIGDEDVLLEVMNVGVCGSDLHQWTADHAQAAQEHMGYRAPRPLLS